MTAEEILAGAESRARLVLVRAEEEIEQQAQRADDAQRAQLAGERVAEIGREAAEAAQAGLDAGREADAATAQAVRCAAQAAELEAALAQCESVRRQRSAGIEELTAAGEIERAKQLEAGMSELDPEPVREALARVREREHEARDRAAEREAAAAQHSARAADLRAALDRVGEELEPEFEQRRMKRAAARQARLFAFDQRFLAAELANRASSAALLAEESAKVDSSDVVVPAGPTIEVDADGRLLGVAGPIRKS